MKIINRQAGLRAALFAVALCGTMAAQAASGFIVDAKQQATIKEGMSKDQVRTELGRPAHNLKYRTEPGRTWTYGVVGTRNKVFEIDFSSDGKVLTTGQFTELMD
jgi:outer membrane protein assembly factor BamE (lipoprotein component of BamABCDE complex)